MKGKYKFKKSDKVEELNPCRNVVQVIFNVYQSTQEVVLFINSENGWMKISKSCAPIGFML